MADFRKITMILFIALTVMSLTACFDLVAQNKYVEVSENSTENIISLGPTVTSDGEKVIYTLISEPEKGTLDTSRMPLVSYAPNPNYIGGDILRFKLGDGNKESNVAAIKITVLRTYEGNQAPVARITTDGEVLVAEGDIVSLSAETSEDTDGSIVSYIWLEGDQFLCDDLSYDANLSLGSHTITLRVTDDRNATTEDTIEVVVDASVD